MTILDEINAHLVAQKEARRHRTFIVPPRLEVYAKRLVERHGMERVFSVVASPLIPADTCWLVEDERLGIPRDLIDGSAERDRDAALTFNHHGKIYDLVHLGDERDEDYGAYAVMREGETVAEIWTYAYGCSPLVARVPLPSDDHLIERAKSAIDEGN